MHNHTMCFGQTLNFRYIAIYIASSLEFKVLHKSCNTDTRNHDFPDLYVCTRCWVARLEPNNRMAKLKHQA